MLRIGLTGGIGSGKSVVCNIFRELGVPIIDSDEIARSVVQAGSPVLQQIKHEFGNDILLPDGSLDRSRMRELVFSDERKRQKLEALLHPLIRAEMEEQIATISAPYVILAIPLLLEKGWQQYLDRIVVVDCSESQQIERACARDNSTNDLITRIIASQISREERLAAADDIIDNSGQLSSLYEQVRGLHHAYLHLTERT